MNQHGLERLQKRLEVLGLFERLAEEQFGA